MTNATRNPSCSIFFYEGYVGIAPTIINLVKSLDECGYFVTIYATKNHFPKIEHIGNNTRIVYLNKISGLPFMPIVLRIINKFNLITLLSILNILELLLFIIGYFVDIIINNEIKSLGSDISIGVDANGSIAAMLKSYFLKNEFIYLSLELNHPNNFKRLTSILPIIERLAYQKSKGVIVQDEDRFKTLCEYNQYQHPQVFYLPNSDVAASSLSQDLQSKNYFREIFNLSEDEFPHLILMAGVINDAVLAQELTQAFASINQGYALILHEREKRSIDDFYLKILRKNNSKNLFLSLDPLPYEQIDKIYASATIGLAFYSDLNNNLSQISKASGKLSQYLKHGKPVLVNNLKSLSELVEAYKIGVVIKNPLNPLEIEAAIQEILNNYTFYSENAKLCFEEEFDFAKKVKPILSFISGL
jgi:glycosyltransferase involved in cell wall biosynthesis